MPHDGPTWPPDVHRVHLARDGDRRALADILAAGYPRLVGFFRTSGVPPSDAEDLAAATCEGVVRNVHRLRRIESFEAWFWTIARARLRTWIKRTRRPDRPPPVDPAPRTPEDLVAEREEHARLAAALEELNPRDRELLWLREVEGLTYEEIGGRFRSTVGTVRVACHRARQRLLEAYERLDADADGP